MKENILAILVKNVLENNMCEKLIIKFWIMPSGEQKIVLIKTENQRDVDGILPSLDGIATKEDIEKINNIMIRHVNCPCDIYRQGKQIDSGILKSYDPTTMRFEIE